MTRSLPSTKAQREIYLLHCWKRGFYVNTVNTLYNERLSIWNAISNNRRHHKATRLFFVFLCIFFNRYSVLLTKLPPFTKEMNSWNSLRDMPIKNLYRFIMKSYTTTPARNIGMDVWWKLYLPTSVKTYFSLPCFLSVWQTQLSLYKQPGTSISAALKGGL